MLRSMQLENFKAFGQRTVIPLAPITLIFGQNSAGKSSILQSLNLLKQTRESRDVEALLLPRTENGLADLGSFQEMLFDHDLERCLSIRLDVALNQRDRIYGNAPRFIRETGCIGLEFSFSRKTLDDEITLDGFLLCADDLNGHLARFEKCEVPTDMPRYGGLPFRSDRRRAPAFLRAARCVEINIRSNYWNHAYDWSVSEKDRLQTTLEQVRNSIVHERITPYLRGLFEDEDQPTDGRERLLSAINSYIDLFSRDFSYREYVNFMADQQAGQVVALDGFIPTLSGRGNSDSGVDTVLSRAIGRASYRRSWTLDVGDSCIYAGRVIEDALSALFPLGPFRKPPSRWYIFTGTTPQDVGYQGHLLPDLLYRQNALLDNTNDWLRRLNIGYQILIRHLGNASSDLFELRLVDTSRNNQIDVGLSDVGFGISQILPLVVQSLAASNQIISIEQPEVHIHPRLQADLGDLLIEAINEPRRNQFIIETHSEHLALRLQRRVREKALSPNDISIVYVSRGPNGAVVQPLRLDDEGDFLDDFPGGFFPERLRELR